MAGSFEVIGSDIKVHFEYQAPTATVISIVGDAAEYLFDKGFGNHGDEENPIVFGDLSNQDKLDLVDDHVRKVIINLANTFKSQAAQVAARELEAESEYSL